MLKKLKDNIADMGEKLRPLLIIINTNIIQNKIEIGSNIN